MLKIIGKRKRVVKYPKIGNCNLLLAASKKKIYGIQIVANENVTRLTVKGFIWNVIMNNEDILNNLNDFYFVIDFPN